MSMRKLSKAFIGFVGLGLMTLGIWFIAENVIGSAKAEEDTGLISSSNNQVAQMNQLSQSESGMTLEELSAFNGTDGQLSYVAVDGIIYDVSKVSSWEIGTHYGLEAGQDLTVAFANSPHSASILDKAIVIGVLLDERLPEMGQTIQSNVNQDTRNSVNPSSVNPSSDSTSSVATVDSFTYSAETIKTFNGLNGNPAYIAVNGTVYDVTGLDSWSGGNHNGYQAGADLTNAFASSPHAMSVLDGAIIVGTYSENNMTQNSGTIDVSTTSSTTETIATTTDNQTASEQVVPVTTTTAPSTEVWTLGKLAAYNGLNGNPAYIAVSGTIYDVTSLGSWSGGNHKGYQVGVDLTSAFASSPHAASILNNAPVIGYIGELIVVDGASNPIVDMTQSNATNDEDEDDDDDYEDEDEHDDYDDEDEHDDYEDDHEDDDHDDD